MTFGKCVWWLKQVQNKMCHSFSFSRPNFNSFSTKLDRVFLYNFPCMQKDTLSNWSKYAISCYLHRHLIITRNEKKSYDLDPASHILARHLTYMHQHYPELFIPKDTDHEEIREFSNDMYYIRKCPDWSKGIEKNASARENFHVVRFTFLAGDDFQASLRVSFPLLKGPLPCTVGSPARPLELVS